MTGDQEIGFFGRPLAVGEEFVRRLDPNLVSSFAYVQLQAAAQGVDDKDFLWFLLCGACCRRQVYTCVIDGIVNYGAYDCLLKDYRDTRAVLAVERSWAHLAGYDLIDASPDDCDYDISKSMAAWCQGLPDEDTVPEPKPRAEAKKLQLHSALFSRAPYMYAKWFGKAGKACGMRSSSYATLKHVFRLFKFKLQKETEADKQFKLDSEIMAAMEKQLAEMNSMQMHLN